MNIMISLEIPGRGTLQIKHLVLDVNGTLALDGQVISGVPSALNSLRQDVDLHLLTADTHGKQSEIDQILGTEASRVTSGQEAEQKAAYVEHLGAEHTAALGQGANDRLMLAQAALGVCLISPEGTALSTLQAADLTCGDILTALNLFLHPTRLIASLRR